MMLVVYVFVWIVYDSSFAQDGVHVYWSDEWEGTSAVEYAYYDCIEYDSYSI